MLIMTTKRGRVSEMSNNGDFERLVLDNQRLVYQISKKYTHRQNRHEHDDIIAEGMLGLVLAAKNFDPERGNRFTTYAWVVIEGYILRYVREKIYAVIRLPRPVLDKRKLFDAYLAEGLSVSREAVTERLSLSDSEYDAFVKYAAFRRFPALRLDAIVCEDGNAHGIIGDTDIPLDCMFTDDLVRSVIGLFDGNRLLERVFVERFIHGRTQSEISAVVGKEQSYVGRIIKRIIRICETNKPYLLGEDPQRSAGA
jgi:DNA-directed RNA polymerase specialized sigma subunit